MKTKPKIEITREEAKFLVWLYDNVHMPNTKTTIYYGEMRPYIEALRGRLKYRMS